VVRSVYYDNNITRYKGIGEILKKAMVDENMELM
ncbi:hypothetical protein THOM_2861, partial [Trachipleistophora hominis]